MKTVWEMGVDIAKGLGDADLLEHLQQQRDNEHLHIARATAVYEVITSDLPENRPIEELEKHIDSVIQKNLDSNSIWQFLMLCSSHWDSIMRIAMEKTVRTTIAKQAANARHEETRSMKAAVFTWLDSQPKFKSIESAAMAITKQEPIAHVTARDWYKEWKKLRSASTP